MASSVGREKKVDLPPKGKRNADPFTDAPGSHPIETGIGAAVAGAASGMAVGVVAGPVAAAVGVAVGAVAGGYAGKGIGEMIDPTTEDTWLRDNFKTRPYVANGDKYEDFHPAYRYGALAESKYGDAGIDLMDQQLQSDWEASKEKYHALDAKAKVCGQGCVRPYSKNSPGAGVPRAVRRGSRRLKSRNRTPVFLAGIRFRSLLTGMVGGSRLGYMQGRCVEMRPLARRTTRRMFPVPDRGTFRRRHATDEIAEL